MQILVKIGSVGASPQVSKIYHFCDYFVDCCPGLRKHRKVLRVLSTETGAEMSNYLAAQLSLVIGR